MGVNIWELLIGESRLSQLCRFLIAWDTRVCVCVCSGAHMKVIGITAVVHVSRRMCIRGMRG